MKLLFMIYFYYEHQPKGPPVGTELSTIYEIYIFPRSYLHIKKQDPEYTLLFHKSSVFMGFINHTPDGSLNVYHFFAKNP